MKFCCGVTLYYPSLEELSIITEYSKVFDKVFIFDNTDNNSERLRNEKYFVGKKEYMYISNYRNEGLSVAYNVMCKRALSEMFDYICLFDQDSIMKNADLYKMISNIKEDKSKDVAIYVPEIVYLHKKSKKQIGYRQDNKVEVNWAISSGSFINLSIYKNTDGFDENYFIDRLDYDYCYEVKRLGYKIVRFTDVYLFQKLGEQKKGIINITSQHSALRHYYIFRNRLYFYNKRKKSTIRFFIQVSLPSIKHIFIILLLEDHKVDKVKMIYRGLKDYLNNHMGQFADSFSNKPNE